MSEVTVASVASGIPAESEYASGEFPAPAGIPKALNAVGASRE